MLPENLLYGVELHESEGPLTNIDSNGLKEQEKIAAKKVSYTYVFEDIYQTMRMGKDFPVTEEQIIAQLELLK